MAKTTVEYLPGETVPERGVYSIFHGTLCLGEMRFAPFGQFPEHASVSVTYRRVSA